MSRQRGDGLLLWMGASAVGLAFYAPHVGIPVTVADALRLILVPCVFGAVLTFVRALGDRL